MQAIRLVYDRVSFLERRARKYASQSIRPARCATPVFVVGRQRSGTNLLVAILDQSYETWIYNEAKSSPAFVKNRIRPNEVLDALIRRSHAKYLIFKPLCDSQWVDRLLTIRSNAKAIWLYRDYRDVAGSAARKFGARSKNAVRLIAMGQTEAAGWRGERITSETMALLKRLYSPTLSDFAGAAIVWYMRNRIYFDLGLPHRTDVILAKYEDLVMEPDEAFPRLFEFLGCHYQDRFIRGIFNSSVGGSRHVHLPEEVEEVCDSMLKRLDSLYRSQGIMAHV